MLIEREEVYRGTINFRLGKNNWTDNYLMADSIVTTTDPVTKIVKKYRR